MKTAFQRGAAIKYDRHTREKHTQGIQEATKPHHNLPTGLSQWRAQFEEGYVTAQAVPERNCALSKQARKALRLIRKGVRVPRSNLPITGGSEYGPDKAVSAVLKSSTFSIMFNRCSDTYRSSMLFEFHATFPLLHLIFLFRMYATVTTQADRA